jgi:hypothetical protein
MLKIPDVLTAVTAVMQAIPELVALAPVTMFDDENSQYKSPIDAVNQMDVPSILVTHENTELGREPGTDFPRWVHLFHVYFRFERSGEGWAAIDALINGVPDVADGSTWMSYEPDPKLYPPIDIAIDYVHNADGFAIPRLAFRTIEIGG